MARSACTLTLSASRALDLNITVVIGLPALTIASNEKRRGSGEGREEGKERERLPNAHHIYNSETLEICVCRALLFH